MKKLVSFAVSVLLVFSSLVYASAETNLSPCLEALKEVVLDAENKYGSLEVENVGWSYQASNLGLIFLYDVDEDGDEELTLLREGTDETEYGFTMQIWDYDGSEAVCVYSGPAKIQGVDGVSIDIIEDTKGNVYYYFASRENFYGWLSKLKGGRLVEMVEFNQDYYLNYSNENNNYYIDDEEFNIVLSFGSNFASSEPGANEQWEMDTKSLYTETKAKLGIDSLDSADKKSGGIGQYFGAEYLLSEKTVLDRDGIVSERWTYDYNSDGNITYAYCNGQMREEYFYDGEYLIEEKHYTSKGDLRDYYLYDKEGRTLKDIEYNEYGNIANEYSYDYDENGRLTHSYEFLFDYYYTYEGDELVHTDMYNGDKLNGSYDYINDSEGRPIEAYLTNDTLDNALWKTWKYYGDGIIEEYIYCTNPKNESYNIGDLEHIITTDKFGHTTKDSWFYSDGSDAGYNEHEYNDDGNLIAYRTISDTYSTNNEYELNEYGKIVLAHRMVDYREDNMDVEYISRESEYDNGNVIHTKYYDHEYVGEPNIYCSQEIFYLYKNGLGESLGYSYN